MKKISAKLKKFLNETLMIILSVAIFIAVIVFFRYIGLKGLLGFVIGVLVTGFVFMSEFPFIKVYREMVLK